MGERGSSGAWPQPRALAEDIRVAAAHSQKQQGEGLFLWDTLLPCNTANQRSPGRSEVCAPSYALGSRVQVPSDHRAKGAGQVP